MRYGKGQKREKKQVTASPRTAQTESSIMRRHSSLRPDLGVLRTDMTVYNLGLFYLRWQHIGILGNAIEIDSRRDEGDMGDMGVGV